MRPGWERRHPVYDLCQPHGLACPARRASRPCWEPRRLRPLPARWPRVSCTMDSRRPEAALSPPPLLSAPGSASSHGLAPPCAITGIPFFSQIPLLWTRPRQPTGVRAVDSDDRPCGTFKGFGFKACRCTVHLLYHYL